ncbi:MAG: hydantoinase/oxoprolinase family protein, partial [Deltaproteobacteria bacterium]|nr:hydantoinase/oxoprolinase family protein [Deltaproteobacteria bacterium]
MPATIDIDIGGTFTDCFLNDDAKIFTQKEATTHYDLSVGLLNALKGLSRQSGLRLNELLHQTTVFRYSTTIAMNALLERKGPKLGLITTAGFEDTIYIGKGSQWAHGLTLEEQKKIVALKKPDPLIPREMTVGLRERVECFGHVVIPLKKEEVLKKVQYLVDRGCQGFVVSLLWSFMNAVHEKMVKEVIEEEYPEVYLGSFPILLSSEVSPTLGEYPRTMTAVLSGYLHSAMGDHISGLGEELRDREYRKPMLIVHSTGGMAKPSRTRAVDTYNAGPVAGLFGGLQTARQYGLENVIVADMGGTSFDIGLIHRGALNYYQFNPIIDRWQVQMSRIETKSIGAGGGSIAWIRTDFGALEVGPKSAGSMPGPACYDLGGTEPTVTDADLLLGYIDPNYFVGGRRKLNKDKADKAMEKIADPLGISVEEAALRVKRIVDGHMGNEIFKETALRGFEPQDFVIFAMGGAGPAHCCGFASHVNIGKIYVFPFSSVFCAFGSSQMDIMHLYEESNHIILMEPYSDKMLEDIDEFNRVVGRLQTKARADLAAEGFEGDDIIFILDLEMRYGMQLYTTRFEAPMVLMEGPEDVTTICKAFDEAYGETYDAIGAYPEGGISVETFILKAKALSSKYEQIDIPLEGEDASGALKGKRPVMWDEKGYFETPIYQRGLFGPGNKIQGPAIVEAK